MVKHDMRRVIRLIARHKYDILHFALGLAAVKTGLVIPITLAFTVYEAVDTYVQVKAEELMFWEEKEHAKVYHLEHVVNILEEKKELRKDLGEFILGLLVAALF